MSLNRKKSIAHVITRITYIYNWKQIQNLKQEGSFKSISLQDRSLTKPFDFSIHLASNHQPKHLEIAQKGPNWMPKRRRNIPFDEKMAVPS